MSTIDFPNKGRDEETAEGAEQELEASEEALDVDADDADDRPDVAAPAPSAPATAAARPTQGGAASIGIALLLVVSLAAVAVLWKQRVDLRAQVSQLETQLAEAQARETQTQNTVGDVAKQLEGIQTLLADLLGEQAAGETGSHTESAARAALPEPAAKAAEPAATPSLPEAAGATAPAEPEGPPAVGEGTGSQGSWIDRALERGGSPE